MEIPDFKSLSLMVNFAIFGVSAVIVWIAGTRIARYADKLATLTGIGHATVGLVLLAGITSLPEVAVSLSAAVAGSPALAINNLLGSIAMQIAILAVADAIFGKEALTVVAGTSLVLLQVTMNILLLLLFGVAVVVGDISLFYAGAWSWGLLAMYAFAIWKVANSQDRQAWVAKKTDLQRENARKRDAQRKSAGAGKDDDESLKSLAVKLSVGALAILVAGFLLSRTGDAIAEQTGLGQSFVGAVFVAVSTSLPEVSSVLSAVKLRRLEMAISDIFGTNLFNVALVLVVDAVYGGGPVLNEVGQFSLVASSIGGLLATIYLIGLVERRDRTIARMGVDSFAVLLVYLGGLVVLYQLR